MTDIGISEILLLVVLGILIFGGDLPEITRNIGRVIGDIQQYFRDVRQEVENASNPAGEIPESPTRSRDEEDAPGTDENVQSE